MQQRSKKYQKWQKDFITNNCHSLEEILAIITKNKLENFNATIDLVFHLNLNPKKPDHLLKGFFTLPHPQIKSWKMCVFTNLFLDQAKKHNPAFVGGKELVEEIAKNKKIDFDLVLASPEVMSSLGKIAKMLGTQKLMPNNKFGTLNKDLETMIIAWKKGRSTYQLDTTGNLHLTIGKIDYSQEKLIANFNFCLSKVLKLKPSGVKGKYIKSIHISSTMGHSFQIKL